MSSLPNSSFSNDELLPLGDVICRVEVRLGTATISVRDCLHMTRHSIISLQQTAGSDMQVTVNDVPIASGEVVIVDDSTAIRVTEILPPPSAEIGA